MHNLATGPVVRACNSSARVLLAFGIILLALLKSRANQFYDLKVVAETGQTPDGCNSLEPTSVSKRSRAIAERLEQMKDDLKRLLEPTTAVHSSETTSNALRLAQTMGGRGRVVFLDRPLTLA